ncbi:MAG: hypothetical protein SPL13_01140 [Clostridia bacterium]|nr:hypothetical protein [Clostridia bacterium]
MAFCKNCGKELIPDEVGLTKKLINRASTEFLCKDCLSKEFDTTTEKLDELIKKFKDQGCMLFSSK